MPRAADGAERVGLDAVGKDEALRLDAVRALVPGVQHALELGGLRDLPQLAIDEADQVVHREPMLAERGGEGLEVRRPVLDAAVVHKLRPPACE